MTDGWVRVPDDSSGKRMRTDYVTTSGGTVVHTEYVRADSSRIVASNASFAASIPGVVRVQNLTAASFVVSGSLSTTPASYQKVLNASYASFLAQISVPGYVRVQSLTGASFIVQLNADPSNTLSTVVTLTSNNPVAILNAAGVGIRNYITSLAAGNTSASATRVEFYDRNTTGPRRYQMELGTPTGDPNFGVSFTTPLRCTANATFIARLVPTVTDVRVSIIAYTGA